MDELNRADEINRASEAQKWPTDKNKYDKEYLRIYGKECPRCKGLGIIPTDTRFKCPDCNGIGYREKLKER